VERGLHELLLRTAGGDEQLLPVVHQRRQGRLPCDQERQARRQGALQSKDWRPLGSLTQTRLSLWSRSQVLGGAVAAVAPMWFESLFKLGAIDYMDVLSVHPYVRIGPTVRRLGSLTPSAE
jgi:hypothetical protein